ncbi:MAG TPA: hypothetical protein VFQ53_25975 [Kofleriaceae bacterium]|nr:hypothetical protein [Kofleriaceae bacterium]
MKLEDAERLLAAPISRLTAMDQQGLLAAPVDLQQLFGNGVIEAETLTTSIPASRKEATLVTGSVDVPDWYVASPIVVMGDVVTRTIDLRDSVVVVGTLRATEIRGTDERHALTVLGAVTIGRAIMTRQYIMQFLGGGTVDELIDEDGGADELVELLEKAGSLLRVGATGTRVP